MNEITITSPVSVEDLKTFLSVITICCIVIAGVCVFKLFRGPRT